MKSALKSGESQPDDLDFPISRSFFPESMWFRATRQRPCCVHYAPFSRDQELDALRQELQGWRSTAAYWQGRCGRLDLENERLQRLLDTRASGRSNGLVPFRGVESKIDGLQ